MYSHNFKTLCGNNSQLNWYTGCMRKKQRCWSNVSGVRVSGWSLASCQPDIIRLVVFSVASRPQKPLGKGTTGHLPLLSHSSKVLPSHFNVAFTSTETVGAVRDWSSGHRPLLSHNSGLGSVFSLQCCFTSTKTIRKGDPRSLTSLTQLPSSDLQLQCCFTSTEIVREGDPRSPTSSFIQLPSSDLQLQCCFTSTEIVREGDPRSPTSSFIQLPSSDLQLQCCFTSTEIVREGDPRSPTSSFTQFRPVALRRPQRPLGKGTVHRDR